VLHNLGQLVRITWLWLLLMIPVYAATHWLVSYIWALPGMQTAPRWVDMILISLPTVVEMPFLASIAVAWHRLVLRQERVSALGYLRLDGSVWLYVLYSLGLLVVSSALLLSALVVAEPSLHAQFDLASFLIIALLIVLAAAAAILVVPRLSLVLPAIAVGERLSLWHAWIATRDNTLRLALATGLCMLPALFLIIWLPLLSFLLWNPSWEETQQMQERPYAPNPIDRLLDSAGYAVVSSLAYSVLAIFALTLLSLAYRFFTPRGREDASPPA
jgi:hypothetical protein